MYILTYKLMGNVFKHHRKFMYLEDMNLFIKKLKPTEILLWEEVSNDR